MTGKSRCEMRRCVYIWTQIYREWIQTFAPWLLGSPFSRMCQHSRKRFLPKNRLGCRNLRRHSHLQTWWTHIFFFFLSPFLFFSSRLPWLVISLSACPHVPAREFFFIIVSVDLCWTERMTEKFLWETLGCGINLDASMKKSHVESFLFVCQSVSWAATITNREPILCIFMAWKIPAIESHGMPQPAVALSIPNTMNPLFFFLLHPVEAAHLRLPRRPPQFGGGVAATKQEQEIRKKQAGEEEGGQKEGRGESAGVPARSTPSYREVASDLFLQTFRVHGCRNLETAPASTAKWWTTFFPLFLPPLGR